MDVVLQGEWEDGSWRMIESAKLCICCCRYGTKSAREWCFCCSSRKVMMSFNADPEQSTLFTLKMSIRRDFLVSMTSLVLNLSFAKQSSVSPNLTGNFALGSPLPHWRCLSSASFLLPIQLKAFKMVWRSRPPPASAFCIRRRTEPAHH